MSQAMMPTNNYRYIASSSARFIHSSVQAGVKDYYSILSVPRNATAEQIKAAYYLKSKLHHPDASGKNSTSAEFREITKAYEILGDRTKRRAYDSVMRPAPKVIANQRVKGYNIHASSMFVKPKVVEPINEKHINHVYNSLTTQEREVPVFKLFEDHHYPNTEFNRFEYDRRWDANLRMYVYTKRPDAHRYDEFLRVKGGQVQWLIVLFTTFTLAMVARRFI